MEGDRGVLLGVDEGAAEPGAEVTTARLTRIG